MDINYTNNRAVTNTASEILGKELAEKRYVLDQCDEGEVKRSRSTTIRDKYGKSLREKQATDIFL